MAPRFGFFFNNSVRNLNFNSDKTITFSLNSLRKWIIQFPFILICWFINFNIFTLWRPLWSYFWHLIIFLGVRYFLPSVRVTLIDRGPSDETIFQIDEKLETCLAEKILELGKIRPIFRFSILDQNLTISSTESYFQFGKGKSYKVNTIINFRTIKTRLFSLFSRYGSKRIHTRLIRSVFQPTHFYRRATFKNGRKLK